PGSYTRPAKYFSAWWTAWVRGEGSRDKPRCLGRHRCRCVVVQEAAGLVLPQPGVGSVEAKQLLVRALLGDLAAFEHDQLVHARPRPPPDAGPRARPGPPPAATTPAGQGFRSPSPARWSPRPATGSARHAGPPGPARLAAAARRTASRHARRPSCRIRPAEPRRTLSRAPPAPPAGSPRRSRADARTRCCRAASDGTPPGLAARRRSGCADPTGAAC